MKTISKRLHLSQPITDLCFFLYIADCYAFIPTVMESHGGHQDPSVSGRNRELSSSILTPLSTRQVFSHSNYPIIGKSKNKYNFVCEICHKRLPSRREYAGHMNGKHLGKKPFACEFCGRRFAYVTSLPMHRKTCPGTRRPVSSDMSSKFGSNMASSPVSDIDNRSSRKPDRQLGPNIDTSQSDVVSNQEALGSDTGTNLKVEFLYQSREKNSQE